MIYLYAVVDTPPPSLAGLTGLSDAPVVSISQGPTSAICSVHASLEVDTESASLWQHEHVTAVLMTQCTVVPVRFGTVLANAAELRDVLSAHGPRLASALARLRGRVELAVRATTSPPNGPAAEPGATTDSETAGPVNGAVATQRAPESAPGHDHTSGRAYLRSLRGADPDVRSSLSAPLCRLHSTLAAGAVDSTVQAGADGSMVAAYLVDDNRVAAFPTAVAAARADDPQLRVSLTGPWAPFSFVEDRTGHDV